MEVYSTVQKSICQQISDLLCQQTELTDQERVAVMSQFINLFKKSWHDTMEMYKEKVEEVDKNNEPDVNDQVLSPDEDTLEKLNNDLEDAAVHYEAVLLLTSKHRAKADSLSQLLGSTTRMALLEALNKKVDLPLRCHLDWPVLPSARNDSRALKERILQADQTLAQTRAQMQDIGRSIRNIRAMD